MSETVRRWGFPTNQGVRGAAHYVYHEETGRFSRASFAQYFEDFVLSLRGPGMSMDVNRDPHPIIIMMDNATVHNMEDESCEHSARMRALLNDFRVIVYFFAPGCTHVAQPEDVATNGAFKTSLKRMLDAMSIVISNPVFQLDRNFDVEYIGIGAIQELRSRAEKRDTDWLARNLRQRLLGNEPRHTFATALKLSQRILDEMCLTDKWCERIKGSFDATGWFPFRPEKVRYLYLVTNIPWRRRLGDVDFQKLAAGEQGAEPDAGAEQPQTTSEESPPPVRTSPRRNAPKIFKSVITYAPPILPDRPTAEWEQRHVAAAFIERVMEIGADLTITDMDKVNQIIRIYREGFQTDHGPVLLPQSLLLDPLTNRLPPEVLATRASGVIHHKQTGATTRNEQQEGQARTSKRTRVQSKVIGMPAAAAAPNAGSADVITSAVDESARITSVSAPEHAAAPDVPTCQGAAGSVQDEGVSSQVSVHMSTPTNLPRQRRRTAEAALNSFAAVRHHCMMSMD
jgi:hypothetical protein